MIPMLANRLSKPYVRTSIFVAAIAAVGIAVLNPRLGIRDVDGYAYVIGARSLHAGAGYRSLTGDPLNHWPPGYPLLLSWSGDSIAAATVVNYASFGLAVGWLYLLLRRAGWSWQAAAGWCSVLASGFFRLLANEAHADILTYALFLAGICAATSGPSRLMPSLTWALLIPVKLIAAVFLPSAVLADSGPSFRNWKKAVRAHASGLLIGAAGIGGLLVFNRVSSGAWIPATHQHPSFQLLLYGARRFVTSLPRTFLFNWHGPLSGMFPLLLYAASIALAVLCLTSLQPAPELRWFRIFGVCCLAWSAVLLLVRFFDPSARLVGYGLIALLIGLRPAKWANWIWLSYGAVAIAAGVLNGLTVNSLGCNDPRYAELAVEVRRYWGGKTVIATNSFHLLDLHANIPSVPVVNEQDAAPYEKLLWVTLPGFDPGAVARPVVEFAPPRQPWCEEKRFTGAVLFTRCEQGGGKAR